MQVSKFSEEQVAFILKQVDDGVSVEDTCRNAGISVETYSRLRMKYGGLSPPEIRRLRELQDENTRLKRLIAELIVEKSAAQGTALEPLPASSSLVPVDAVPAVFNLAVLGHFAEEALRGPDGLVPRARSLSLQLADHVSKLGPALASSRSALTGLMRYPGGSGLALVKSAASWTRQRSREVSWPQVREESVRLAKAARDRTRGREILIAGIAGGLAAGFAFGIRGPAESRGPATVPVSMEVRLTSYGGVSGMLEHGWDRPQPWGTWMSGNDASIILGFDGPAPGDVELLVEARAQPIPDKDSPTIVVRFNDAELGRWRLPAEARELRRRFIVPEDVFNRSTEARLSFAISADQPTPTVFGVQSLQLRDARLLTNFKGFVDSCTQGKLVGWAIAEDTPVSIGASIGGEPVRAALTNVERPDLASHGLPIDAGFELTPATPITGGSTVDVRFANGQPLTGSPCTP
jgi:putative transposase